MADLCRSISFGKNIALTLFVTLPKNLALHGRCLLDLLHAHCKVVTVVCSNSWLMVPIYVLLACRIGKLGISVIKINLVIVIVITKIRCVSHIREAEAAVVQW